MHNYYQWIVQTASCILFLHIVSLKIKVRYIAPFSFVLILNALHLQT